MTDRAKEYWQINTENMAKSINKAAESAITEEDLKMALEPILRKAYEQIGVNIDIVQCEKSTALKAKIDAVYGYLIIEYKRPGKLNTSRDIDQAAKQLERYLTEESSAHRPNDQQFLEKAVGVAIDGRKILFVRYTRAARFLSTPIPIEEGQKKLFPEAWGRP